MSRPLTSISNNIAVRASARESQVLQQLATNHQTALDNIRKQIGVFAAKGQLNQLDMHKYKRLENLQKRVESELKNLRKAFIRDTKGALASDYEDAYTSIKKGIQHMGQVGEINQKVNYALYDRNAVKSLVANPLVPGGWTDASKLSFDQTIRQTTQALYTGLVQGDSYENISQKIAERLEINLNKAAVVVRTEGHRCRERGKLDSMKEAEKAGVKQQKRWLATMDAGTRDSHAHLDGKQINLDEDFHGEEGSGPGPGQFGVASEDINCRCTLITVIKDAKKRFDPNVRMTSDGLKKYSSVEDFRKEQKKLEQHMARGKRPPRTHRGGRGDIIFSEELKGTSLENMEEEAYKSVTGYTDSSMGATRYNQDWFDGRPNPQVDMLHTWVGEAHPWGNGGELYRGLNFSPVGDKYAAFADKWQVGNVVETGFTSWTSKTTIADGFAGVSVPQTISVKLRIAETWNSTSVRHLSSFANEDEVLMNAGTKLMVIKREMTKSGANGVLEIFVKEVYDG